MESTTSPDTPETFAALSDDELVDRVRHLAGCERRASVTLIRSLVEFDTRQLYLREGCSSLFTFCTRVLHLSEGSAYNRIETARASRRYPKVLEALEHGDLTLTAIRLLAPHLTSANHDEVLRAARHKSKLEIQELIAALKPRPAAATIIRRMPPESATGGVAPPNVPGQQPETALRTADALTALPSSSGEEVTGRAAPQFQAAVTPLAPEIYKLQVSLARETIEKLRRAQALARHTLPSGDVSSILDRALTLLIDHLERRRFARASSPRTEAADSPRSGRYLRAGVRRAVWQRDEGRCAFVGHSGRCRETSFLEFHHVVPYAAGGAATADNVQLRCRAHNKYEVRLFFGDGLVRERGSVWMGTLGTDARPARRRVAASEQARNVLPVRFERADFRHDRVAVVEQSGERIALFCE